MVGATLAERAEAGTQGRTLYRRSKARWPGLLARGAARRRDSARVPLLAKTGEAAAAAKRRGEVRWRVRRSARGRSLLGEPRPEARSWRRNQPTLPHRLRVR